MSIRYLLKTPSGMSGLDLWGFPVRFRDSITAGCMPSYGVDGHTKMLCHFDTDGEDIIRHIQPTMTGPTISEAGHFSGALDCAGGGSYNYAAFSSQMAVFTVDFWLYQREYKLDAPVLLLGNDLNEAKTSVLKFTSATQFSLSPQLPANSFHVSSVEMPLNSWKHVCLTFDGTAYKLYIDGVQAAVVASTTPFDWTRRLWLSSYYDYNSGHSANLKLDEFRVSDNVRTEDPKDPLFANGGTTFTPPVKPYE